MELGQIIGIVGGVVGIAGLMVLLIWCIFRKSKLEKADSNYSIGISAPNNFSIRAYSRPNINASKDIIIIIII